MISMNGGDGINSYTKNSKSQEEGWKMAKVLLSSSIQENLEIPKNSHLFSVADLGCSVGPNTFSCVQAIIDSVLELRDTWLLPKLEFQVFFNDHVTNDFNTLFKNLPLACNYMAAGVPGSFHGRLFPKASMNLMNSSIALHWLTRVPNEVMEEVSPAWNRGRITYGLSSREVLKAFSSQFSKDIDLFSSARLMELASGGLITILIPCQEEDGIPSDSTRLRIFECLGSALIDMVKEGLIRDELLDSFNLPFYFPTASEVENVVAKQKHLKIKKLEVVYQEKRLGTPEDVQLTRLHIRAVTEGLLSRHFGSEIVDELFQR